MRRRILPSSAGRPKQIMTDSKAAAKAGGSGTPAPPGQGLEHLLEPLLPHRLLGDQTLFIVRVLPTQPLD